MKLFLTCSFILSLLIASGVQGAVLVDGDVTPSDPATWAADVTVVIGGNTGNGTVSVDDSDAATAINSEYCLIGGLEGTSGIEGTLSLSGTDVQWTTTMGLGVGIYGTGLMNITDGATMSVVGVEEEVEGDPGKASIGYAAGASGVVNVSGTGSTWAVNDDLIVGEFGSGELNILDGGGVTSMARLILAREDGGTDGTVNVSDSASTLSFTQGLVGARGEGAMYVTNGATVNSSAGIYAGVELGGDGLVEVSGTGSNIVIEANSHVGYKGTGTLNVSDGASLSLTGCYFGSQEGSNGTGNISGGSTITSSGVVMIGNEPSSTASVSVSGSGTQWDITSDTQVGRKGTGELNILAGGKMNSTTQVIIGHLEDGIGTATVSGAGSEWNMAYRLYLGSYGTAELAITDGGKVDVTSYAYLGYQGNSSALATVTGTGSELSVNTQLTLGHLNASEGTLRVTEGGTVYAKGFNIGYDYQLEAAGASGTVEISGAGSTMTSVGTVYVGRNGIGTLDVSEGASASISGSCFVGTAGNGSGTFTISGGSIVNSGGFSAAHDAETTTGSITISGTGSQWNVTSTGASQIGRKGSAELSILDGGKLTINNGSVIMGNFEGIGSGVATVDGAGSEWRVDSTLHLGNNGYGELTISDGGKVSIGGAVTMANGTASTSVASVSGEGSQWLLEGGLNVGDSSGGAAELTVTNAGLAKAASLSIGDNGYLNMSNGGTLALLGDSGYTFETLLYNIGSFDHLQWWNETLDDWQPMFNAASYSFNIPEEEYSFDYHTQGDLSGHYVLTVGTYVPDEDIPGDANKDGKVDGSDVTILAGNWQKGVSDGLTASIGKMVTSTTMVRSMVPTLRSWRATGSTASLRQQQPCRSQAP